MQTNIAHSIQEYCKKINSQIDKTLLVGLFLAFIVLASFSLYVIYSEKMHQKPIIYKEGGISEKFQKEGTTTIFASRSGKTYTFSWCKGASRIKESNRQYFASEEAAKLTGRRLSKLCE